MTAVFCRAAEDRKAETWREHLAPFEKLEFVVSDAAKGITKAVAQLAQARRADPAAAPLEHGLDLFHTAREARGVLAGHWRRAEAAWEKAEAADRDVARAKSRGLDARGVSQPARSAWARAIALSERADRLEAAWARARAALELFGADGRLNDRAHAEAEIAGALGRLEGPEWSKLRNYLKDPRSLSFLDRMNRRLESAEPRAEWRQAMAWRWRLRHRRGGRSAGPIGLVEAAACHRALDGSERASYERVSAVLRGTVRASGAVECMNSVLRMQHSRHKRMTQPMLDLKRLYWNCHEFRSGPREKASPYQTLGLKLESFDFWAMLQTKPTELAQRLSSESDAE